MSPSSVDRKTLALQATIMQATNIDDTRRTNPLTTNDEYQNKSKSYQSLEIDSSDAHGSGTENRRAKRRNKAKQKNLAQSTQSPGEQTQYV